MQLKIGINQLLLLLKCHEKYMINKKPSYRIMVPLQTVMPKVQTLVMAIAGKATTPLGKKVQFIS